MIVFFLLATRLATTLATPISTGCSIVSSNSVLNPREARCVCLTRQKKNSSQVIIWKFKSIDSLTPRTLFDGSSLRPGAAEDGWAAESDATICIFKVGREMAGVYEAFPDREDVKRITLAVVAYDVTTVELLEGSRIIQTPGFDQPIRVGGDHVVRMARDVKFYMPYSGIMCQPEVVWKQLIDGIDVHSDETKRYSVLETKSEDKILSTLKIKSNLLDDKSSFVSESKFKCPDFNNYSKLVHGPVFYKDVETKKTEITSTHSATRPKVVDVDVTTIFGDYTTATVQIVKKDIVPPAIGETVGDIYMQTMILAFSIMFPFFIFIILIIVIVLVVLNRRRQARKRRQSRDEAYVTTPENEYSRALPFIHQSQLTYNQLSIYDQINEDHIHNNNDDNVYYNQVQQQIAMTTVAEETPVVMETTKLGDGGGGGECLASCLAKDSLTDEDDKVVGGCVLLDSNNEYLLPVDLR